MYFFPFENFFYNSKWLISVRKSSPNDEIHSNYMTGNDYSFSGNERKMFPFCINLPKDLIIVYAKVQLNILGGLGVINFGTLLGFKRGRDRVGFVWQGEIIISCLIDSVHSTKCRRHRVVTLTSRNPTRCYWLGCTVLNCDLITFVQSI